MAPAGKPAGSGTARMDASKAAQMEELIKKEQRFESLALRFIPLYKAWPFNFVACRIQARAEEWQRAAGLLPPEPQVLTFQATKAEPVPEPALMSTVHGDPEAFMTLNLSRNLNQGANPAYQLRDGFQTQSCMKADFNWDQEEVPCVFLTIACSNLCQDSLAKFLQSLLESSLRLLLDAAQSNLNMAFLSCMPLLQSGCGEGPQCCLDASTSIGRIMQDCCLIAD